MAVLPKVKHPTIPIFAGTKQDTNPPPQKKSKIVPSSPCTQLFDPTCLHIHKPWQAIQTQSQDLHATIYDDGFQCFFKNKFLDMMSNGETYAFNLDDFTWLVHQLEVETVVTEQSNSTMNLFKTPPVYHYHGHFYYLGMQILPIYQQSSLTVNHWFQLNEVLPFVESHLAPNIFDPLLSQMHWKRGNKLVDIMQTTNYPSYCIHMVNLEEGVIVTHFILTPDDKEDTQELKASGVPIDVNHLPHEYVLCAFQLQLMVGNNVKVIAGIHKSTCSAVVGVLIEEGYVQVIPYGDESNQYVSQFCL